MDLFALGLSVSSYHLYSFDATYLYEYTFILLYNLVFTSLPVISLGGKYRLCATLRDVTISSGSL